MQSYIRVDAELMDCDHENDHNQNKDAISGLNLTSTADPNYGGGYWTSTEYEYDPQGAWVQDFHNGGFGGVGKEAKYHVRAVRLLKRN
jgi:hypothetical protein